jgi:hypothetical protein
MKRSLLPVVAGLSCLCFSSSPVFSAEEQSPQSPSSVVIYSDTMPHQRAAAFLYKLKEQNARLVQIPELKKLDREELGPAFI